MKDQHDIEQLKKNGKNLEEFLTTLTTKDGKILLENMKKYEPKEEIIKQLVEKAHRHTFIVFSAPWCKDCKINVAALAKIVEKNPNLDVLFFSGIKTAPLDPNIRWKVPPSPPEVNDFDLRKIPTIYILNSSGKVINAMVENPKTKETLEEELLFLLEEA
jgi:thiol-disulfide isomerase/thioredoxin